MRHIGVSVVIFKVYQYLDVLFFSKLYWKLMFMNKYKSTSVH